MDRVMKTTFDLETKKKQAFLGYAVIQLYGWTEDQGSGYDLQFGTYNDRGLVENEVKRMVDSFLNHGFLQYQESTAIPIGVLPADIYTEKLTTDPAIERPAELSFREKGHGPAKGRRIIAFGGQHRTAAIIRLSQGLLSEIQAIKDRVHGQKMKEKRGLKAAEGMELQENQGEQKIKQLTMCYQTQRWWKAKVYDLSKYPSSLYMYFPSWSVVVLTDLGWLLVCFLNADQFTDRIDFELGRYLSRNERLHVYRETPEEMLAMHVHELANARVILGGPERQQAVDAVMKSVVGTRIGPLLQASHSAALLEAMLLRGPYWRHLPLFSQQWMTKALLGTSGGVGTVIICFVSCLFLDK
jgi:hypothetical protein